MRPLAHLENQLVGSHSENQVVGSHSLMLTSARPPTRAWEVARTVVAPPLSVVKCLWEVFVWGSCRARVCRCRGCFLCRCVLCACDLLIVLHDTDTRGRSLIAFTTHRMTLLHHALFTCARVNLNPITESVFLQTVYNTKGTRAHTHRELIREWLWEPKGSSLEYF